MSKVRVELWVSPFHQPVAVVHDLVITPAFGSDMFIQRIQINPNIQHYAETEQGGAIAQHIATNPTDETIKLEFNYGAPPPAVLKHSFAVAGVQYEIECVGVSELKHHNDGRPMQSNEGHLPGVSATVYRFDVTRSD